MTFDQDGWLKEIDYQTKVGPFNIIRTRGGEVRLSVGEDDYFVWQWNVNSTSTRMEFAEILANALAAADRRFEVRSTRP